MEVQFTEPFFGWSLTSPFRQVVIKLILLLSNYRSEQFWPQVRKEIIKYRTLNHQIIYQFLVKLMNEESIKEKYHKDYNFLFFGKPMQKMIRLKLVQKCEEQLFKFKLYILIDLLGKEELVQYIILVNTLIEGSQLTINLLKSHIIDPSLLIKVQEYIKNKKQEDHKKYNPDQILSNLELNEILQIIQPINLTEIRMLKSLYLGDQNFEHLKDLQIYIFVGPTGIGKSTLILYLLGYKIQLQHDKNGYFQLVPLDLLDEHKEIVAKYALTSVTNALHLARYSIDGKNIGFIDTPGDNDTRGCCRKFFNFLLKRKLYQVCKTAKIIDVASISSLSSPRIEDFRKYAQYIMENYDFKDRYELNRKLTVILNKCDNQYEALKQLIQNLKRIASDPTLSKKEIQVCHFLAMQVSSIKVDQVQVAIPTNFYKLPHKRAKLLNLLMKKQAINPQSVIKGFMDPEIKIAVNSTYRYFIKSAVEWLKRDNYDITLYYFESSQEIAHLSLSIHLSQEFEDFLKKKFSNHYTSFTNIISKKCQKIYSDEDFKEIVFHLTQLRQAQQFKDYFGDIRTVKSLENAIQKLIHSYRQRLNGCHCPEELIRNYRKFLQIFGFNEDPSQPLMLQNQNIFDSIKLIISNQQEYAKIDKHYEIFTRNSANIQRLSQNGTYSLLGQLATLLQTCIIQKFHALNFQAQVQIQYLSKIGRIQKILSVQLLDRQLPIYQSIKKCKALDESLILKNIKVKCQQQQKIINQKYLLHSLSIELVQKFNEFSTLLQSEKIKIYKDIVKNFICFMKPYLQIQMLSQIIHPHQQKLKLDIQEEMKKIFLSINNFQQIFTKMITTNQVIPKFQFQAEQFKKDLVRLQLFSQFMSISYHKQFFLNLLCKKLRQTLLKLQSNAIQRQSNSYSEQKQTFLIISDKYTKLKMIRQIFPQINEDISEFVNAIQVYFLQLCQNMKKMLSERRRIANFKQVLKNEDYHNWLRFTSFIYNQLTKISYNEKQLQGLDKELTQVYQNCENLSQCTITYQKKFKIRADRGDQIQIYVKTYFSLFYFLNLLATIPYFKRHFNEKDIRTTIISNLWKELQNDEIYIQKKIKQRQFEQSDPIVRKISELDEIKKDTFTFNNHYKDQIKLNLLNQLKKKFAHIEQLVFPNNNNATALNIRQDQNLMAVVNRFIFMNQQQKHNKVVRESINNQLIDYIKAKIDIFEYDLSKHQITFSQYQMAFIKKNYFTLNTIKNILQTEVNLQINELTRFMSILEKTILQKITEYFNNSERSLLFKNLEDSKKQMQKIMDILTKTHVNLEELKDKSLGKKINQLHLTILTKQQDIKKLKHTFQNRSKINVYGEYQEIQLLAQNHSLALIRQKVVIAIRNEISQLSTNYSQTCQLFNYKYNILERLINAIYRSQDHIRNNLDEALNEAKSKFKIFKQIEIKRSMKVYQNNYGMLMELQYKSQILVLADSFYQLKHYRQQLLKRLSLDLKQSHNCCLRELFQLLIQSFWIKPSQVTNISQQARQHFLAQNQKQEKEFIQCIFKMKIQPYIKRVGKLFENKIISESNRIIERDTFDEFIKELTQCKEYLYNPLISETIIRQMTSQLQAIYNKYFNNYTRLFQVFKYTDFSAIDEQIKFARLFQNLNQILLELDPINLTTIDKVKLFQTEIRDIYSQLNFFDFRTMPQSCFKSETKLRDYLQKLQYKICLIKQFNQPIEDFRADFSVSISKKFMEYSEYCKNLLQIFFKLQQPDHLIIQQDLLKSIQFESILPKIKNLLNVTSQFRSTQRDSSTFLQHIEKILQQALNQEYSPYKIDQNRRTLIRMKKISIYFSRFADKCSIVIKKILIKVSIDPQFYDRLLRALHDRQKQDIYYQRICKHLKLEDIDKFRSKYFNYGIQQSNYNEPKTLKNKFEEQKSQDNDQLAKEQDEKINEQDQFMKDNHTNFASQKNNIFKREVLLMAKIDHNKDRLKNMIGEEEIKKITVPAKPQLGLTLMEKFLEKSLEENINEALKKQDNNQQNDGILRKLQDRYIQEEMVDQLGPKISNYEKEQKQQEDNDNDDDYDDLDPEKLKNKKRYERDYNSYLFQKPINKHASLTTLDIKGKVDQTEHAEEEAIDITFLLK